MIGIGYTCDDIEDNAEGSVITKEKYKLCAKNCVKIRESSTIAANRCESALEDIPLKIGAV
jgi:hypothetical protein